MKKILLILVISCAVAKAATYNADSPALADVQAKVDVAITGDTVLVPAGTAVWTNYLSITQKGIHLQGAGTNSTFIIDGNTNSRSSLPSLMFITYQVTNVTGAMLEIDGFKFLGTNTVTSTLIVGAIRMRASNNMTNDSVWRIHDCAWSGIYGRPIQIQAWSGLVDRNDFDLLPGQSGLVVDNSITTVEKGDRSWAEASPRGTTNRVYVEGNRIHSPSGSKAAIDGFTGARYTFRYNITTNRSCENHGTESAQRKRSTRDMEVYGNTFNWAGTGEYAVHFRGGSGLVFSNTVVGAWPGLARLIYDRATDGFQPFRQSNGTNVWDLNIVGGPFESGTHTGGNATTILTDATKTWSTDQWVGYEVINMSQYYTNGVSVEHKAGLINGNGPITITRQDSIKPIFDLTWNTGDSYQVWRVDKCLDAPGRGHGALLVGTSDSVPPTPTTWPNQVDSPIYCWANTGVTNIAAMFMLHANRDYISSVYPELGVTYFPLIYPHPLTGNTNQTPVAPTPSAPTNLLAEAVSSTELNIHWTNTATNASDIRIEQSLTAGSGYSQISVVSTNLTNYVSSGLNAATTYYYRIRAANAFGFSSYSNETNATTTAAVAQRQRAIKANVFKLIALPR